MNRFIYISLSILIFISCRSNESTMPPANDRNLTGTGIERGLQINMAEATPGYVYFSPLKSSTTYLVNNDGKVVHTWESKFGPSGWMYLKEDGNLVRGGRDPKAPIFGGGGQGGWIEEFNWEGELVWQYRLASEKYLAHHDIAIMPNGNILAIVWEEKTPEEVQQAGRKADMSPIAGLWPDAVLELKPVGKDDAEIVWEWHIWDHLIQDHDPEKANYGDPSLHPELVDLNIGRPLRPGRTQEEIDEAKKRDNAHTNSTPENGGSDVYHINAINYNAELDQIVLSSPNLNEVFIIDHSTTSEEAASHEGGRWGKGGDLLYRWGNPENYRRGDSSHRRLGGQHDIKWVPEGFPGAGNLLVYNNSVPNAKPGYSAIYELETPLTESDYLIEEGERFGPENTTWSYLAKDSVSFFAPFISGVHRINNGNTFITEGTRGRYFEVNPEGDIVWEYLTPYAGYVKNPDGTSPQPVGPFVYASFRATFVPVDYPGLAGKTLEPLATQPEIYKEEEKGEE